MKVLSPSPPPSPTVAGLGGPPSPAAFRRAVGRGSTAPGERERRLHVAVGRSPEKTLPLLRWAFRRFGCREIGLLHVHQPSPLIPTLLGKIPASQANEELVSVYRRTEKEITKRILLTYLRFCHEAQVQPSIIMTEAEQIQNGIVDLVVQHGIRRLVMGSAPDNCFKLKGSSSKVTYAAKNAPPFCEIWFVCKGRHVWTREASEGTNSFLSVFSPDAAVLHKDCCDPLPNPEYVSSNTFMTADLQGDRGKSNNTGVVVSTDSSIVDSTNLSNSECPPSCPTSPVDIGFLSEINSQDKLEPEVFFDQLKEVNLEVERSKKEAFVELVKRREVETEVEEALDKVKALEAAHAREIKIREELEDLLTTIKLQHKELINQRDETMKELQNALSTIATLDAGAQEMSLRRDEAAAELDLIQSSIAILRLERQKIQEQEEKAVAQLERWRCNSQATSPNCSQLIGFGGDSYNLTEFALSDLESATCGFSGSFKLGQGGYGCVYKGEIFNRSVVIKKLHPHNVQGQMEFQQEVC